MTFAVCVDVGSTYTKVVVVDLVGAAVVAAASHPTTSGTDVLTGLDAAVAQATAGLVGDRRLYVCSSAGGGLRLAVVGYEALVTAEAGHRVGLSAGAQVVHVAAGALDGRRWPRCGRPAPTWCCWSVGRTAVTVRCCGTTRPGWRRRGCGCRWWLAGNADVRADAAAVLAGRGVPVTVTSNVLPRIGVLDPGPARAAIREVFLRHVIGGKRLSKGPRFASVVRAATPDAVLAGGGVARGRDRVGGAGRRRGRGHHRRVLGADAGRGGRDRAAP